MKELIPMDMYGVFANTHDTPRVDSRFVAEFFEKNHRDVLRSIRTLVDDESGLSKEFRLRKIAQSNTGYSAEINWCNFAPISYGKNHCAQIWAEL